MIRVDLRPSDDSSLTWSGREREEGEWKEQERGGRREEREKEKRRRRGGEGGSKRNQKEGGRVEKGKGET